MNKTKKTMVIYTREQKTLIIPEGLGCSMSCEEQYREGYDNGYASGYTSGYTDGYNSANMVSVDLLLLYEFSRSGVAKACWFNDVPVVTFEYDAAVHLYWATAHTEVLPTEVSTINKITFMMDTDMSPETSSSTPTYKGIEINGVETTILSHSITYVGEDGDYSLPYRYMEVYNIAPVSITDYGRGFQDGYNAGIQVPGPKVYARYQLTFSQDTIIPANDYMYYNLDARYYTFDITETAGGGVVGKTLEEVIEDEMMVLAGNWVMSVELYNGNGYNGASDPQSGREFLTITRQFPNCTANLVGYYNRKVGE